LEPRAHASLRRSSRAQTLGSILLVATGSGHDLVVDQHAEEGVDIVIGRVSDLPGPTDRIGRRP
jgi:hypothetical protein